MAATRVGDRSGAPVRVPFGRYALLQLLAATRLGGVHRAESNDAEGPGVPLAIKWLKPERSRDPDVAVCFMDVMARARRVGHEGCCSVFDIGRAPDGSLFAALEWVSGKDWKRVVAGLRKEGKAMPPTLVAYVGIRIAEALEAAHQLTVDGRHAPLYHGELSGADILIGYDGKVRLCGLGSGELSAAARLPPVRTAFRAPELAHGAALSAQSDVFSLGACLYQALAITGGLSSEGGGTQVGDRPESLIRHVVPGALLEIVQRAVAEDPRARFASADELARALSHWGLTQSSPGDAYNLAEFMTSIFEQSRSGPMNDVKERTPAQPIRARKLAATMSTPKTGEEPATLPAPVAKVAERSAPRTETGVTRAETGVTRAEDVEPAAAIEEPVAEQVEAVAALEEPDDPDVGAIAALVAPVASSGESVASSSEPVAKAVAEAATSAAGEAEAAAKAALEDDWEREPWETAAPVETAWSVAPPARPVPRRQPVVTPPGRLRAGAVPMPRRPTQPSVATAQRSMPPAMQSAATATPIALPAPTFLAPEVEPSRAAWQLPVFVGGALLLVFGGLFLLRGPSEKPPAAMASPAAEPTVGAAPAATPTPTEPEPAAAVRGEPAAAAELEQPLAKAPEASAPTRSERTRRESTIAAEDARGGAQDEAPSAQQATDEAPEPATPSYEPPAATAALAATPTPVAATRAPSAPAPTTPTTAPVASARPAVAKPAPSAQKPAQVFAAAVLEQTSPRFPSKAKRLDITEGKVSIDYTVDASGGVRDLRVVASSPKGIFDDAAIEALKQWRYRPKVVDGKPVESRLRFTFNFQ